MFKCLLLEISNACQVYYIGSMLHTCTSDTQHAGDSSFSNHNQPVVRSGDIHPYIVHTRNELASFAHSFYTCLKHQLMHHLYSSALPWKMLYPRLYANLFNANFGKKLLLAVLTRTCTSLADHVTFVN